MGTPSAINYIGHLNTFYQRTRNDHRLNSTDMALYLALFHIWNSWHFKNPFAVQRTEAMKLSHIGSNRTYNDSLRKLQKCGYIVYLPPEQPFMRSTVCIQPLVGITIPEQPPVQEKRTGIEPDMEDVKIYFLSHGHPADEGARFFFYYQSFGWSKRGSPITNWKAAAQKWMQNIGSFSKPKEKPSHLHINQNKNYGEPL
ncbi:hypothetical protein [Chitinophaga tropicalis]|uniref:Uncharacterized protein n=1 Tax=Chitinophaga tropicalis TaxID=2683588 RepID=A0A7K1U8M7_9BACT|nr:hypothetical protein [Chitinophaga tropicalis]MVT10648.1 hypothetical protein [Chitinophaga tropicalis]